MKPKKEEPASRVPSLPTLLSFHLERSVAAQGYLRWNTDLKYKSLCQKFLTFTAEYTPQGPWASMHDISCFDLVLSLAIMQGREDWKSGSCSKG